MMLSRRFFGIPGQAGIRTPIGELKPNVKPLVHRLFYYLFIIIIIICPRQPLQFCWTVINKGLAFLAKQLLWSLAELAVVSNFHHRRPSILSSMLLPFSHGYHCFWGKNGAFCQLQNGISLGNHWS